MSQDTTQNVHTFQSKQNKHIKVTTTFPSDTGSGTVQNEYFHQLVNSCEDPEYFTYTHEPVRGEGHTVNYMLYTNPHGNCMHTHTHQSTHGMHTHQLTPTSIHTV